MPNLTTDIQYIKGIGQERAKSLAKLGIFTLEDLLNYFPRRYEDRTEVRYISEVLPEETACFCAVIATEPVLSHVRRGMDLVKFRIVDESGSAEVTYFNQSYVRGQIHKGETYYFYGKVGGSLLRKTLANPVFEAEAKAGTDTGRIVPLYRLTRGISNKVMITSMQNALTACGNQLPELLPAEIIQEYGLTDVLHAYENVHFPKDFAELRQARHRLIFEELFVLSCAMSMLRQTKEKMPGYLVAAANVEEFYATLPFSPTDAQRRAVADALSDMSSGQCMNRLVQGDVGSGKTMVAAACLWTAWKSGYQGAFMAPTEILATQHVATLQKFLTPFGMHVELLKGSLTAAQKRDVKARLALGQIDVIVGTHALLSEDVEFAKLGLAVTDEQHRFGVNQRAGLSNKGQSPHVLVMSATPIPRTLALMIYGDLDVSVLNELPPGRQKIDTVVVSESYRERLNTFIRKQVSEGHQVFVVCPMVEENEESDLQIKSATEHAAELQKVFPDLRIGCVHGKMKPKDKDAVMEAMANRELDVLVSTTVVEVGVDIPNATLMIVENAERFGLSQLHQLRGRVGRGKDKSYCVLVTNSTTPEAKERLHALVETNDGFAVAEEDLRLRGPGDFFGQRQHGLPEMHVADLAADLDVLNEARRAAEAIMEKDPTLSLSTHSVLKEQIQHFLQKAEKTLN